MLFVLVLAHVHVSMYILLVCIYALGGLSWSGVGCLPVGEQAGMDRTGEMAGNYMMAYLGYDFQDTLDYDNSIESR